MTVVQKGLGLRYKDGTPAEMIAAEADIAEDAEDSGHMAINYGAEPLWFRFGLPPNTPLTGGHGDGAASFMDVANADAAFSNALGGRRSRSPRSSPRRPEPRCGCTSSMPTGSPRASSFTLHGHLWQRAPYVCPGSAKDGLAGKCLATGYFPTLAGEVASRALGTSPISDYTGSQDLVMPGSHFDIVLPSAGGAGKVTGDYLFMDRAGLGTTVRPVVAAAGAVTVSRERSDLALALSRARPALRRRGERPGTAVRLRPRAAETPAGSCATAWWWTSPSCPPAPPRSGRSSRGSTPTSGSG